MRPNLDRALLSSAASRLAALGKPGIVRPVNSSSAGHSAALDDHGIRPLGTRHPFESSGEWQSPSRRLRQMRRWETASGTLVCLAAGTVAAVASGRTALAAVVPVPVLVAGGVLWFYMARRFGAWGYLERDEDLLVRRGVMFRRMSVVPYGRMQTVEVTAGPIERYFHLATVRLHTASAATDARIPGLEGAAATALRDRLATLGESRAEGL